MRRLEGPVGGGAAHAAAARLNRLFRYGRGKLNRSGMWVDRRHAASRALLEQGNTEPGLPDNKRNIFFYVWKIREFNKNKRKKFVYFIEIG
jgi:hypothetical protein